MGTRFSTIAAPADLGRFVDADERDAMIEGGTPLSILGVRDDPHNRYAGKPSPRYLFDLVVIATGERVTLGLRQNAGRDHLVAAIREALADDGTIDPVILVQRESREGNAYATFDDAPVPPMEPAEEPAERLRPARRARLSTD